MLALVLALVLAPACSGDQEPAEHAAPVPTSTGATFDLVLTEVVEDHDIPAAVVAVRLADGTRWVGAAGDAEVATPFRLASITKTYLAALAMLLVDDGVLDLDAPVGLTGVSPNATLRHLLSHTSGLPHDYPALRPAPWDEEALAALSPSAVCAPGTCFEYTDLGYIAAGLLIERETGAPLDDLLHDRLLDAHDLDDTFFAAAAVPRGTAMPHRPDGKPQGVEFETRFGPGTWAAGAMVATAPDLLAWGEALFGGEVVGDRALAAMTAPTPYGLGLEHGRMHGRPFYGHGGSTGTYLAHLPDEDLTVAVATNRSGAERPVLEKILEAAGVPDRADIYAIDVDGSSLRRLTTAPEVDGAPWWSPDDRIVFGSARGGTPGLYVMAPDGSDQRLLVDHPDAERAGRLTPDGKRVLFTSDRSGNLDIWSSALDGSDLRQVTDRLVDEAWASPSPDGRRAVLELVESGEIAVVDLETGAQDALTLAGPAGHPSWSPDGERIVYVVFGDGIRTARPDGSDVTVVTTDDGDRYPAWGPSGVIAFVNQDDLWTVRADGTGRRRLTRTEEREFGPTWSPDGTRLAFASDRS